MCARVLTGDAEESTPPDVACVVNAFACECVLNRGRPRVHPLPHFVNVENTTVVFCTVLYFFKLLLLSDIDRRRGDAESRV